MNECEVLSHVIASTTVTQDRKYLAVAQSVLDFLPVTRRHVATVGILWATESPNDAVLVSSPVTRLRGADSVPTSQGIPLPLHRDETGEPAPKKRRLSTNACQSTSGNIPVSNSDPQTNIPHGGRLTTTQDSIATTVTASTNDQFLHYHHKPQGIHPQDQSPITISSSCHDASSLAQRVENDTVEEGRPEQYDQQDIRPMTAQESVKVALPQAPNQEQINILAALRNLPTKVSSAGQPLKQPPIFSHQSPALTRSLQTICDRLPISKHFRPISVSRQPSKFERGQWIFRIPITTTTNPYTSPMLKNEMHLAPQDHVKDPIAQTRSDHHPSRKQVESSAWPAPQFLTFWNDLSKFIRTGKIGEGIELHTHLHTHVGDSHVPSHSNTTPHPIVHEDHHPHDPDACPYLNSINPSKGLTVKLTLCVKCPAYLLAPIWLLIWVLSDKHIAGVESFWESDLTSGTEGVRIVMSGNRATKGDLGIWTEGSDGGGGDAMS